MKAKTALKTAAVLRKLMEEQNKISETIAGLLKKTNEHSNQIYMLERPANQETSGRVVQNQLTETPAKQSSTETVRSRVCHVNGHRIGVLERNVPNTELPELSRHHHNSTTLKQEVICLACGMTIEEIRTLK